MIKIVDLNKKFLLIGFAVFSFVYFTLDHLNLSYSKMASQFGIWLVLLNILLNLVMAGISAFMLVLSDHVLKEKNIKTKGDNMGILSLIVGIPYLWLYPLHHFFFHGLRDQLLGHCPPLRGLAV